MVTSVFCASYALCVPHRLFVSEMIFSFFRKVSVSLDVAEN